MCIVFLSDVNTEKQTSVPFYHLADVDDAVFVVLVSKAGALFLFIICTKFWL